MSYKHVYDPVGWEEYKEAVKWYKERSAPAAGNFVKAINEKIALICSAPATYRSLYKKTTGRHLCTDTGIVLFTR